MNWADTSTRDHVNAIVNLLGLQKHRHKDADELSGGYKRRLCLALALIGYPRVMALDECTTGLDPGARHLVWKILKPDRQNLGYDLPAILLSSHYMDECQELGTRIGIMIDGEIVSTGSLKELYSLYCTSFFVEVSFESSADDSLSEELIVKAFESTGMEASIYESLPFHVKLQISMNGGVSLHDNTEQLADIFRLLESKKVGLAIRFYSVARMNLEQIFINLSRKQFQVDEDIESTRVV
jgi:ABC-type multidrug transport system ATPase subunit